MPPIDAGEYFLSALVEMGFAESSSSGFLPLRWSEIDAYSRLTGTFSEPWESRLIRSMSSEYIAGRDTGMDELGIPPWGDMYG